MSQVFTATLEIRFSDLDAYGHVNNATYFTYLESARVKVFSERFIDFMNEGLFFVVARAECDYKKPIKLEDREVTINFHLSGQGRTSFEVDYEIFGPKGQLFAKAKTVMVALDAKTGSPMAIPQSIGQKLFA
ncbi:MAG: thioesterase family protein [bacterium]|nr:thioesterase family protein [bacterium]